MATNRNKRTRSNTGGVSPLALDFLHFGHTDESALSDEARYEWLTLAADHTHPVTGLTTRQLWQKRRDGILSEWANTRPGRRPFAWWAYDSSEPRRRLGGTGTAAHDVLNYLPAYRFGIPAAWIATRDFQLFKRLTEKGAQVIDPADPPLFESEPAYLERLGLLTDAERTRLTPADFEPVPGC